MQEESILNLIPKEVVKAVKPQRYTSKYPPNIVPTSSTIGLKGLSKPYVRNVGGHYYEIKDTHPLICQYSTMNKPMKSNITRLVNSDNKFNKTNEEIECKHNSEKKPLVPRKDELPIILRKAKQNFIMENIINNVFSAPPKKIEEIKETKKKGEIPNYLKKIKQQFQEEKDLAAKLIQEQEEEQRRLFYELTQEEIEQLRSGLLQNFDKINREYQQFTHIRYIDNLYLKRKKEGYEQQLKQIEADLAKLSKGRIYVDTAK